ncbi:hypothetical protein TNIN_115781 [Trichonephila inaurata madagascariensis]|uniref:Uncharacterized protein n=1 Tax=Trichonephila inaurata madagascariensis TaxID=2747483 RepID=A0A8X6XSA1_9ARAC|nr:hypothetical protein TNIN_115781 [Trichonephila inaurata madagascariensis]
MEEPVMFLYEKSPLKITSVKLNDLGRDLDAFRVKVVILASRLQQWNLLEENVLVTSFHPQHKIFFEPFCKEKKVLCSAAISMTQEIATLRMSPLNSD